MGPPGQLPAALSTTNDPDPHDYEELEEHSAYTSIAAGATYTQRPCTGTCVACRSAPIAALAALPSSPRSRRCSESRMDLDEPAELHRSERLTAEGEWEAGARSSGHRRSTHPHPSGARPRPRARVGTPDHSARKIDISTVLAELWRDEVLPENAATRVRVPKAARVDDRKRIILSDAEFTAFMACPEVDHELRTMALVSRTFGGHSPCLLLRLLLRKTPVSQRTRVG